MPNTKNLRQNEYPAILLIGDGGTEKTRFLASCPKPYVFDFDAGMASASEFDCEYDTFKDLPFGTRLKPRPEEGIFSWGDSWPKIVEKLDKIEDQVYAKSWPFQTLGLDSLTTLANQSSHFVLKSASKTPKDGMSQNDWGTQLGLLETAMEQICAWPIRLVVNAHIRRDKNELSGDVEYLPMVAGQLAARIGIYFDEVWFTLPEGTGKDRKILLRTESGGLYKGAKSRHNIPNKTEAKWAKVAPYFSRKAA